MCFGEKFDEEFIRKVEIPIREMLIYERDMEYLAFFPAILKLVNRSRWKWALKTTREVKNICQPLLEARRQHKNNGGGNTCYVDSLLDLKLPGKLEKGLTDDEILILAGEILLAGTDTTSTMLQWTMANVVRNQEIQKRLYEEVQKVSKGETVKEEELQHMPYLKATILEALRRHPATNMVLPHKVKEEMDFEGYVIPKDVQVNFAVPAIGWNEETWEDPMEFKPERFLDAEGWVVSEEVVDLKGSREIKMMPFGAGRRICPGYGLAMLHLEYFVANLVKEYEWKKVDGEKIDLAEKFEFTVVIKNPLRVRLVPRNHG